jgi:hypothetical protein
MVLVGGGIAQLDRLGKAVATSGSGSGARLLDAFGTEVVARGFPHTLADAAAIGREGGLSIRDFDGVLHVYDDRLASDWTLDLVNRPEVAKRAAELEILDEPRHRHLRDAAVAPDGSRVVFGAIDQVWCVTREGTPIWGVQLPAQAGWTRVVERTESYGTASEVASALARLGLQLPVTHEDVKRRYRHLAREWHPDLNPSFPEAGQRMREINAAYEVVTGCDPSDLIREVRRAAVSYRNDSSVHTSRVEVDVGGVPIEYTITAGVYVSEAYARDWISNVAWSAEGERVLVSSSSGRVFELRSDGVPSRVYDVRNAVSLIQAMAGRVYIATATRLYVLADANLLAVEDIYEQGRPVVTPEGVLLWDSKRLTWIDKDGRRGGCVVAKDPIRLVTCAPGGWRVATRQHAAVIYGAPWWWDGAGAVDVATKSTR